MILDEIVAKKKIRLQERKAKFPLEQLKQQALKLQRKPLDFQHALRQEGLSIIAEVKKASPSKGVIRPDFDPQAIARAYLKAGIQAMSILTEEDFFQGSDEYFKQIRSFANIPWLRKDFIIDEYQIYEAYCMGADAILLIAAILDNTTMKRFYNIATTLGMHCLNEVHDQQELERVLKLGFPIVGINNRNLKTFEEKLETTGELRNSIPSDRVVVSESGIRTPEDIQMIAGYQVDGVLIGEAFMSNPNVTLAVEQLRGSQ